jgi:hypothetical protein
MAISETQSQYLLTASVIQPSTRIAGSCFCISLMFPNLKLDTSGQEKCTWSDLEDPLTKFSGASCLCICVRVRTHVTLSALEHCVNKFSCVRKAKERKGNLTNLVTGELCKAEIYFHLFLGMYVAYTFQDFCQHD